MVVWFVSCLGGLFVVWLCLEVVYFVVCLKLDWWFVGLYVVLCLRSCGLFIMAFNSVEVFLVLL